MNGNRSRWAVLAVLTGAAVVAVAALASTPDRLGHFPLPVAPRTGKSWFARGG